MLRVDLLSKLPTQLKWSIFKRALTNLGYTELRARGGSARHFRKGDGNPITFHEPHGNDTLRQGTLTEYLKKLGITRSEFEEAISGGIPRIAADEERYRHTSLPNGRIVSNCLKCFEVVAQASSQQELLEAEASHICAAILE